MVDLNLLVAAGSGLWVSFPRAISLSGSITGDGGDAQGNTVAFVLTPVDTIGDATGDCQVNVDDLLLVIIEWGKERSPADVSADGIVNVLDLFIVIENWTF